MSTLREQFEAFEQGIYLDSDENLDNRCFNFYDWFCENISLKSKADKLFPMAIRFANKMNIDLDKHYVSRCNPLCSRLLWFPCSLTR